MPETLNYVPAKEGLAALDSFIAGKSGYSDLLPFTLPVRWRTPAGKNHHIFDYYMGMQTGVQRYFRFFLSEKQITTLGESIYVVSHMEDIRGQNPYYWLNLHSTPETELPVLTSCRLRPEKEKHKIEFQGWHSLEEQLLADYILEVNNLRFTDLLPFSLADIDKSRLHAYALAGVTGLTIQIYENCLIRNGDTLRFVPRTDDQRLYEWVDILKSTSPLSEERWPLVASYRLLPKEHRMYSTGWLGSERLLLIDRILGERGIKFENLRPVVAISSSGGENINLFEAYSKKKLRGTFNLKPGLLASGTETISIPRQDDHGIYEWLELYRFDALTNGPRGEILASARITPEGINQRDWPGVERQLLKDYMERLVSFEYLKPVAIKIGKGRYVIYLCREEGNNRVYLVFSRSFNLEPDDNLSLVPEKESGEGTDFLLVKNGTTLARYRLDLKTKKFTCIDNLVTRESTTLADTEDVKELEEYEQRLLAGEKLSYEEFMKGRQI